MAIALQTNPDSRLNGIRVFQKTLFVEANGFWTFPPPRSRESSTYTRLAECARLELGKLVSLRTMARLNPISWLAVWKSSWLISVMTIDVVVRANVCTRREGHRNYWKLPSLLNRTCLFIVQFVNALMFDLCSVTTGQQIKLQTSR